MPIGSTAGLIMGGLSAAGSLARGLGGAGLTPLAHRSQRPWGGILGDPGRRLRERLGRREGDDN